MSKDKIEFLPGIKANAHACFGDAIERSNIESIAIAIWRDEKGKLKYSMCGTDEQLFYMLEQMKNYMLNG